MLRYKRRSTSLTIISSFCNSGSVFNNKMIKKEFILGLKVLSVKEYMNLSTFNSIPTLRRFHYHGNRKQSNCS